MKASRIINQARILLVDPDGDRWTDAELLGWLNGGQLQIVAVRPDSKSAKIDITLVDGVEQTIPASAIRLLDVIRNVNGRAITLISRDQLNEFDPDWYIADAGEVVKHYTFDGNDPKSFEVTPPASAGMKVRALVSQLPADCANTDADIALDDLYEGPLIDWVCYRAWGKNSDSQADAGKQANALATFMQALTGKTQTDGAAKPARK